MSLSLVLMEAEGGGACIVKFHPAAIVICDRNVCRRRAMCRSCVRCCQSVQRLTPSTSWWTSNAWFSADSTSVCSRRRLTTSCSTICQCACVEPTATPNDNASGTLLYNYLYLFLNTSSALATTGTRFNQARYFWA